jgi:UDP-4-amino-4,6-dideoxy-N-acetyl-beta-L-altrosamine N-acetyltransferase
MQHQKQLKSLLKPLEKSDLELILPWRNALGVRRAMFTQHEISLFEHQAWFARMQEDRTASWFLYLDEFNQAIGVVYFTDIDDKRETASWGFYVSPYAKRGTGLRMSLEAIDKAFSEMRFHKVNAKVLASNPRSLEMHKKVGFVEEKRLKGLFFNGKERVDVICLGLLVTEWPQLKVALTASVSSLAG